MRILFIVLLSWILTVVSFSQSVDCSGFPPYESTTAYNGGEQVTYNGDLYQANWWTQNEDPAANGGGTNAGDPWTFIGSCSAAASTCDASTPSYTFDLTGNPDSTWLSPSVRRSGICCGNDPAERPPVRCVEFYFTLDPDAVGIIFDIEHGAVPPGALYFQINCQGRYQFGDLLCLSGSGPYRLTFCKPGNNPNIYSIKSVGGPRVSPPVTVSDGCSANLVAYDYDISTIEWTSVPSDPFHESLLSCTQACDSVTVNYQVGAPDSVVYQVCGFPPGGCLPEPVCKQTTVYFVNDKTADIQPKDAMVCFGQNSASLTAYGTGGKPPYQYLWSTGETTQSIDVGAGTYWVEIFDQTSCPTSMDTVEVGAFIFPIVADAGPDTSYCNTITSFQLQGSVEEALGGQWSGGNGTFSPNDSTLNAFYEPTATELVNGVTLTLTTTGNRSCPGDDDQVTISFGREPQIFVTAPTEICSNNATTTLSATFVDATGVVWSSSDGTFTNPSATTTVFNASQTAIDNRVATITATTSGNSNCPPKDTMFTIPITDAPAFLSVVSDISTCENNPQINLGATYSVAAGIRWSGNGTFTSSDTDDSPQYTPTDAEINNGSTTVYVQTTDNGLCLPIYDSVQIEFTPAPKVTDVPSLLICSSETSVSLSATTSNADGVVWSGGTGTFNTSTSNPTTYTFAAGETDLISLDLNVSTSNSRNCLDHDSTFTVVIDPLPSVDLGDDMTVCKNNSTVNLSVTAEVTTDVAWAGSGTGTFERTNGLTNVYYPSGIDTSFASIEIYVFGFSPNSCPFVRDTLQINLIDAAVVDAAPDQIVCENTSSIDLAGTVSSPYSASWQGGSGFFTNDRSDLNASYQPTSTEINGSNLTLYLVSTNNGGCLPTRDSMVISFLELPEVNLPDSVTICGDQPTVTLPAPTLTNAMSGIWSGSDGTFNSSNTELTPDYVFSAQNIVDSTFLLTFTTTNTSPCPDASDNIRVVLTPVPTVDAGNDILTCSQLDPISLQGEVTLATGGIWSTTGTGSFSLNNTDLIVSYIPTPVDTVSGVTLTLTTTDNQGCNAYQDQIDISFVRNSQVSLSPTSDVCDNELPVKLSAVGSPGTWSGLGSFSSTTASNPTYTPTDGEITARTFTVDYVTNPTAFCPSITESLTINLVDGPTVNPDADFRICSDQDQIILNTVFSNAAGVTWSTNGAGSFNSSINNVSVGYDLASSEQDLLSSQSIQFTVTTVPNNGCLPVSENIIVDLVRINEVDAGNDFVVCYSDGGADLLATSNLSNFNWSIISGFGSIPNSTANPSRYNLDLQDTTLSSVDIVVQTTANGTCPDVSDTLQLVVAPPVEINAPDNQFVCEDALSIDLQGYARLYDYIEWSSNGSGTFSSINDLNTQYFFGTSDVAGAVITISLNGFSSNGCPNDVDQVTLTVTDGVTVDAGLDLTVCDSDDSVSVSASVVNALDVKWTTNGNGSFSQNGLNATYLFGSSDKLLPQLSLYATSTGNGGCDAVVDTLNISFVDGPSVVATANDICKDNSFVDINAVIQNATGIVWSTNEGGTFDSNVDLSTRYNLVPADTTNKDSLLIFVETTGNGLCDAETDTLVIGLLSPPNVSTDGTRYVCIGDAFIDLTADIGTATSGSWVTDGDGVFQPSSNLVNTTYYFDQNDRDRGNVTFTITSNGPADCAAYSESLVVTFSNYPIIVPPSGDVCANSSGAVELEANVTDANSVLWISAGSGTYSPSDTSFSTIYTPSVADLAGGNTTIDMELVAISCVSDTVSFSINLIPGPSVAADPLPELCVGTAQSLSSVSQNNSSVTWTTDGAGLIDNVSLNNTSYTPSFADSFRDSLMFVITTSNLNGCPDATDTVWATVTPTPDINTENAQTICYESDTLNLQANGPSGQGIIWRSTSGSGGFIPNVTAENVEYVLTASDKTNGYVTFNVELIPAGCQSPYSEQITVNLIEAPSILDLNDALMCEDDGVVRLGAIFDGANGVSWSTNGGGSFDDVNRTPVNYTISESDINNGQVTISASTFGNNGCTATSKSLTLNIDRTPIIDLGNDHVYCDDLPLVDLDPSVQFANDYDWTTDGQGSFTNAITQRENSYQVVAADTTNTVTLYLTTNIVTGCLNYDSLQINFEQPPAITINSTLACEGDTLTLVGQPTNISNSNARYIWYKDNVVINDQDSVINAVETGEYVLNYVLEQCQSTETALLTFNPSPQVPDSFEEVICVQFGETADVEITGDYLKYYWVELNDSSKIANIDSGGVYNFLVLNEYNCTQTGVANVIEACPPKIHYPTIMNPNDPNNNRMVIYGENIETFDLKIFNRWGEVIYHTNDIEDWWDAKYRDELMNEGVYNWTINYTGNIEQYYGPYFIKGIITVVYE